MERPPLPPSPLTASMPLFKALFKALLKALLLEDEVSSMCMSSMCMSSMSMSSLSHLSTRALQGRLWMERGGRQSSAGRCEAASRL